MRLTILEETAITGAIRPQIGLPSKAQAREAWRAKPGIGGGNPREPHRGCLLPESILGNLVEVQNRLAVCLPRVRTKRATVGLG